MKEYVSDIYLNQDYNCAETTLKTADAALGLGITDSEMRLIGAFGGGMACGRLCGALAASMAVIGRELIQGRAHATEGFRDACSGYVERFVKECGSTQCTDLRMRFADPKVRCRALVEQNAELLESYLKEMKERQTL